MGAPENEKVLFRVFEGLPFCRGVVISLLRTEGRYQLFVSQRVFRVVSVAVNIDGR